MMWNVSGWGWAAMVLVMVLFWGSVIALAVLASRRRSDPWDDSRTQPTQILEERFARGEISADELAEGRRLLASGKGDGGHPAS